MHLYLQLEEICSRVNFQEMFFFRENYRCITFAR